MRLLALTSASLLIATTAQAQTAADLRSNRVQATAAARNIARERDPDARGATCAVFLNMGINLRRARTVGYSAAAMRRAHDAYYRGLVRRLGRDGAAQLVASSGNPLEPALPSARDAAAHWCVRHAPVR